MASNSSTTKAMKDSKFHKLFVHELKDIYWAETQLAKVLPKMSKKSNSKKLSSAIEKHKQETDIHVERLKQVFKLIDEEAKGVTCEAMKGLLEEAEEILESTDADSMVRDAGIIIANQKVEHYEIASYGSLVHMASVMDQSEVSDLLAQTLDEEKKTDQLLTSIAKNEINQEASKE